MKYRFLFGIALASGFLFSVPVLAQTQVTGVDITKFEAASVDAQPKMFVVPLVAEVSIIPNASTVFKTTGQITLPSPSDAKGLRGSYADIVERTVSKAIRELKAKALFEFSEAENADLIVAPIYSIETEKSSGLIVNVAIKVKGYPARYSGFRNLKDSDTTLIRMSGKIGTYKQVDVLAPKPEMERTTREEDDNAQ